MRVSHKSCAVPWVRQSEAQTITTTRAGGGVYPHDFPARGRGEVKEIFGVVTGRGEGVRAVSGSGEGLNCFGGGRGEGVNGCGVNFSR